MLVRKGVVEQDCQLSVLVPVVHPPALFVIVAGGWPASLISVLALKLPLRAVFSPKDLHRCFKSLKTQVTSWTSIIEFSAASITSDAIYFVSGNLGFLWHTLPMFAGSQGLIVTFDMTHCCIPCHDLRQEMKAGWALCKTHGLHLLTLSDAVLGSVMVGGPELEFSSSVTFFPIFGLTAVLKILSFPALASGDNIAD